MDHKHMKRCSATLAVREMQIKTMKHFIPTRMAIIIIKKWKITTVGKDVEKV